MHKTLLLAAALLSAVPAAAEGFDGEAVTRVRLNPFSDRISVPFKNDWNWGGGPDDDGFAWKLEVEPVIPINLSEDWLLISRTIVPFIVQSQISEGPATGQTGFGDTTQSLFLSPRQKLGGWLAWGVGPAFLVPTSTSTPLGNDRFSAGPTLALNVQTGPWVLGFLGYQIWSVTDVASQKQVNKAYIQPAISYVGPRGLNYGINTEVECDWLEEGTQCSVPINFTIGHPVRLGDGVDLHIAGGGRYYAVRTEKDPAWGLRFEVSLIFYSKR
jgi:hypothetical protein